MKQLILPFIAASLLLSGCQNKNNKDEKAAQDSTAVDSSKVSDTSNPLKDVYYGDLHLHTSSSFDAYVFGTKTSPDEAYKFAKGESVNFFGQQVKRHTPLDFLAVTDHSEYLGVLNTSEDSTSELSKTGFAKALKSTDQKDRFAFFKTLISKGALADIKELKQENAIKSAWQLAIDAADKNYDPGKFTTFVAYEWTSMVNGGNLHRNVIFRDSKVPATPFSSIDSKKPEDLWAFLENYRKGGSDVLAIPHNQNVSDGLMYDWNDSEGKPINEEYAQRRSLNEPLSEISQNKGASETHPSLSPTDELANFEILETLLIGDRKGKIGGSYVREAYGRGLLIAEKAGKNPFKFGVIGASDLHTGLSISKESDYKGGVGRSAPPKATLTFQKGNNSLQGLLFGSGNITGVWAEKNTREALFDAFKRKEVFATSGPQLKFRFFGGWDFNDEILNDKNWVKSAYEHGVPMGGDLPAKPASAKAPSFVVWAVKDPNSANLDKVQVIKVWTKEGKAQEKIFDIAASDDRKANAKTGKVALVGNTVDIKTASYQNTIGDTELKAVWTDPEFDANVPAVYYIRVVEIPTPRWSTVLAVENNLPISKDVPATIQERGWSSPIWYTPVK